MLEWWCRVGEHGWGHSVVEEKQAGLESQGEGSSETGMDKMQSKGPGV